MVLDYLVHYGYCNTAQLFASATGQQVEEEMASIRNRQREELLVLYIVGVDKFCKCLIFSFSFHKCLSLTAHMS